MSSSDATAHRAIDPAAIRTSVEQVVFAALLLLPIWLPGPVPTTDGPQHVLAAFLLHHIHDPGRGYDRYLQLQVCYSAVFFDLLTAAFHALLPIRAAAQSALSVLAVVTAGGIYRLVGLLHGQHSAWRWLAIVVPFGGGYYFGFYNYSFGVAFGVWVLVVAAGIAESARGGQPASWRRFVGVGVLLYVTALAHGFAAAVTGLVTGLFFLGALPRRRIVAHMLRLGAASLPALAWLVLVSLAAGERQRTAVGAQLQFDLDSLLWLPRNLFETPFETLWIGDVLVLVAALVTLRGALRRDPGSTGMGLALLGLLVLQPFIPDQIDAWQKLRVRFAPWVLMLAFAGASVRDLGPRVRRMLSACVLGGTLITWAMVMLANVKLARLQREFESGIGAVSPIPIRRFYVPPDPDILLRAGSNMAVHLNIYYMMSEGGVFSSVFHDRKDSHLLARTDRFGELLPRDTRGLHRGSMATRWQAQARMGLTYDEVMLWDPFPQQLDSYRASGYKVSFSHGGLWRLAPPHRRVSLIVETAGAGELAAAVFAPDLAWPIVTLPLAHTPLSATGRHVELVDLPARPIRIAILPTDAVLGGSARLAPLASFDVDLTAGDAEFARVLKPHPR